MFCERLSVGFDVRVSAKKNGRCDTAGRDNLKFGLRIYEKRQNAGEKSMHHR